MRSAIGGGPSRHCRVYKSTWSDPRYPGKARLMWILTLASRLSKAALRHGTGVEVTHQTGHCEIHYDAQLCGGDENRVSLLIDKMGAVERTLSPPLQHLKKGPIWRVPRPARLPTSTQASLITLEDTPFYTRSQLRVSDRQFMHESLDLTRFCRSWVQCLLPFRMPRRSPTKSC